MIKKNLLCLEHDRHDNNIGRGITLGHEERQMTYEWTKYAIVGLDFLLSCHHNCFAACRHQGEAIFHADRGDFCYYSVKIEPFSGSSHAFDRALSCLLTEFCPAMDWLKSCY